MSGEASRSGLRRQVSQRRMQFKGVWKHKLWPMQYRLMKHQERIDDLSSRLAAIEAQRDIR